MRATSTGVSRMWRTSSALLAMGASAAAMALQTVTPSSAPSGGTAYNTTTAPANVPVNGTLTVYGVYSDDSAGPESGLGLKVKYDGTKLTNVTIAEEYTKCRIAPAQKQNDTTATAQVVMGWIDTALRTTGVAATADGSVGWPDLADLASGGCLIPAAGGDAGAGSGAGQKLFKMTATWAAGTTAGATTAVTFDSDGNYSFANAGAGYSVKSFNVVAAAPSACNLDVDGNGSVTPFRDGILILRQLLGLSGASLISGINPAPNATTVQSNITAILPLLDLNGTTPAAQTPFVDGILLLRMMLGLNGTSLTNGITFVAGSTRTTSAQLVGYVNATCGTNYTP